MSSKQDRPLIQHYGVFRRPLSFWQTVALIVSGTVGAGVLGIPYVAAQVGLSVAIAYIVGLGLLMMGLNLLLGEVVVRTKGTVHLAGLAGKYLGPVGKVIMTVLFYSLLMGSLVIYIIGEGEALAALFGGDQLMWSLVFFAIAMIFVVRGLRTIKTIELVLTLVIFLVVLLIGTWGAPAIKFPNISYTHLGALLLPYGVILFSFHGATAIPEAHTLLSNKKLQFKQAIILSTAITIALYAFFTFVVVGVTGTSTTEVATIGLGKELGKYMLIFGNAFAALAMGTGFLLNGVAMTDSLSWDFGMKRKYALALTGGIPLLVFLAGVRGFIAAIDLVGGVFISLEMLVILLIYWRAKQKGDLPVGKYKLHHALLIFAALVLALSFGAVYSILTTF